MQYDLIRGMTHAKSKRQLYNCGVKREIDSAQLNLLVGRVKALELDAATMFVITRLHMIHTNLLIIYLPFHIPLITILDPQLCRCPHTLTETTYQSLLFWLGCIRPKLHFDLVPVKNQNLIKI